MHVAFEIPDSENPDYLTKQLITYLGNKRALLDFIGQGVSLVQKRLNTKHLSCFDVFSGSGIVSRYFKQFASVLYANDREAYARTISLCYLANSGDVSLKKLNMLLRELNERCDALLKNFLHGAGGERFGKNRPGFISELYAPRAMHRIKLGERCFYTPYNACYLDCMRQSIDTVVPQELRHFFIAPLLSEASVHANTGGVFKGFYKNSTTGAGKFGGNGEAALSRITGHIALSLPVFSRFACPSVVFCEDANILAASSDSPEVDLAYLDPPYNQHPYGSNYFMLNLVATYKAPDIGKLSRVSGIPRDWNRSCYNRRAEGAAAFLDLVQHVRAKFLLVSFNSEGFISPEQMTGLLESVGSVTVLEAPYPTYRASRNLSARNIHVKEFLYVVEKR